MNRVARLSSALLMLLQPSLTFAQNAAADQARNAMVTDASRRTIALIRKKVAPFLDQDQNTILQSIDAEITPNTPYFLVAHAFINRDGDREIEFSDGFIRENLQIIRDYLVAVRVGAMPAYGRYLQDTVATFRENSERAARGEAFRPQPSFSSYLKISKADGTRISNEVWNATVQAMIDDLTFIFCHELAHHLHGDVGRRLPTNLSSRAKLALIREQEHQADQMAIKLSLATHSSILSALPTFLLFMEMEPDPSDYANGSHPPGACRLRDIAAAGIRQSENSADWKAWISRNPNQLPAWNTSKAQLGTLTKMIAGDCDR